MSPRRKKRIGPGALFFRQRPPGLLERILEHLLPSSRIVKSDSNRMPDKCRNVRCLTACDQGADFFELMVIERDGDLRGCHTNHHTMGKGPDSNCVCIGIDLRLRAAIAFPRASPNIFSLTAFS